jgi:hypothetical protein
MTTSAEDAAYATWLHAVVDRLPSPQLHVLYDQAKRLVEGTPATSAESGVRHRLSFTGAGDGPADLAERAEEYLEASIRSADLR